MTFLIRSKVVIRKLNWKKNQFRQFFVYHLSNSVIELIQLPLSNQNSIKLLTKDFLFFKRKCTSIPKDSEIGKELPCLHCQLIEMGEMACYQEFCPHCGRVPPSRKTQEDYILEAHGYSRRLFDVNNMNRKQEIRIANFKTTAVTTAEPALLKKLNEADNC